MSKTTIEINGDSSGFEKASKEVKKEFDGISKSAQDSAKKGTSAFKVFLGTFSALALQKSFSVAANGVRAFASSINESIQMAKAKEEAINNLENSMVRAGTFTHKASKDIQGFASSMQGASKFSDDLILKNAALIQSYARLSTEGLKKTTQATADLAAATGEDFSAIAKIIGESSNSGVAALSKFGVSIKSTGDNTKDFALAIEEINRLFGGSAASQLNTYDGATTQLSNTFSGLRETLAMFITTNPQLISGIRAIEGGFQELTEFVKENKEEITSLINVGFRSIVAGSGLVIDSIIGIANAFNRANEAYRFFANRSEINSLEKELAKIPEQIDINGKRIESFYEQGLRARIKTLKGEGVAERQAFLERQNLLKSFQEKIKEIESTILEASKEKNNEELILEREKQSELMAIREQARLLERENELSEADNFINSQQERLEYIRNILGEEEALREEARARELAAQNDYNAALASLSAAEVKARKTDIFTIQKYEKLSQQERVANLQGTLSQIASLQASSTGTLFEIGKASAIGTATMDGFQAVQKALASAPPPINFALAATVGASTAANIANIANTPRPTGAYDGALVTSGSSLRDTEPYMLSRGEFIAPARNFDEVVEGTARQRGFVKQNENSQGNGQNVNIFIDTFLGMDDFVDSMIDRIREKILFENADIGV